MLESCDNRARSEKRNGEMFRHHAEWAKVADAVIEVCALRLTHASPSPVHRLQGGHKGHQVVLLWLAELELQHQVKELDRIVERQQAVIVKVRRGILDPTQGEGLDRPIGDWPCARSSSAACRSARL